MPGTVTMDLRPIDGAGETVTARRSPFCSGSTDSETTSPPTNSAAVSLDEPSA
jgi:hypothetical protein